MAGGSEWTLLDLYAPRREVDPGIASRASAIAAAAAGGSPVRTGRLAGGWTVARGRYPGVWIVTNSVPYARYVEYGTRTRPAAAMLGRARAAGG
jgi:hypothetical protein